MKPPTSEFAEFQLHGMFLPILKNEQRTTKAVIAAIPLDQGSFRPDPIAKTSLELAWHIVATEMRFLDAISAGAFDFTPVPKPESIKNSADLAQYYDEQFAQRFDACTKLTSEQLLKIMDFRGMMQQPAVAYFGLVTHHTIHHRGQLSMYLRPMGAKVPSIYGESYDAAEARKAAAK